MSLRRKPIEFFFHNAQAHLLLSAPPPHKPHNPLRVSRNLRGRGGIPRRINSFQTGQAGNKIGLLIGRRMVLEIPFDYCFVFY